MLVNGETATGRFNYLLEADRSNNEFDNLPDVTARLSLILSQWEEDIVLRSTKQFATLPGEMQRIATASATNVYFSPNEDRILYTATEYDELPSGLSRQPPSPSTQKETRSIQPNYLYVYDIREDRNYEIGPITLSETKPQKTLLLTSDYQQNGDSCCYPRRYPDYQSQQHSANRLHQTSGSPVAGCHCEKLSSPLFLNLCRRFPMVPQFHPCLNHPK
jgi:hypothetical protein